MDGKTSTTKNGWRFDKSFSIGTLLAVATTVIGLGGPILLWGRAMETSNLILSNRVTVLEASQDQAVKAALVKLADDKEQQKEFLARMDKFSEQVTALRITLGGPQVVRK